MSSINPWHMIQNDNRIKSSLSSSFNQGPFSPSSFAVSCTTTIQTKKTVHLFSSDPYEWKTYLDTSVPEHVFHQTRDLNVLFDEECEWVPAPLSIGGDMGTTKTRTKSPNRSQLGYKKQQTITSNVEDSMELTDFKVTVNGMRRFVSISGRTMTIGDRKYTPCNWHP
jgi:hypothetical protein